MGSGPRDTSAPGARARLAQKEVGEGAWWEKPRGLVEGDGLGSGGGPIPRGIWGTPPLRQELGGFNIIRCHLVGGDLKHGTSWASSSWRRPQLGFIRVEATSETGLGSHHIGGDLGDNVR